MRRLERQFQAAAKGAQLPASVLHDIQQIFYSISVTDEATLATICQVYKEHDIELGPHSAVEVCAGLHLTKTVAAVPIVCVLTAHPAKFKSSTVKALGRPPKLPQPIEELKQLPHRLQLLRKSSLATGFD
jgi:threonine synthase